MPERPIIVFDRHVVAEQPQVLRAVRPAGIEPAACGLKDRCSLAPRREPLTTELRALAVLAELI
jgi:hypothetical protein